MAQKILPDDVLPFLRSQTRSATRAAARIPVEAAAAAFGVIVEAAHVYSGAFKASLRVGINELPEIPSDLAQIPNERRHRIARGQEALGFTPWTVGDVLAEIGDYELDDDIIIGSDIHYAEIADAVSGNLIRSRAEVIVQNAIDRRVRAFNARSLAQSRRVR